MKQSTYLITIVFFFIAAHTFGVEFYLSPAGNDKNSGTKNAPFATLAGARDAARQVKKISTEPITVFLRGGVYFLDEPVVFGPEDSGTAEAPIIYQAYADEKPVICAARRIQGTWKPYRDGIFQCALPDTSLNRETLRPGTCFNQLFVNGRQRNRAVNEQLSGTSERRNRARLPNETLFKVAGGGEPRDQAFKFRPGDIRKDWSNLEDIEVVVHQAWCEARLRIAEIDEQNHIVSFTGIVWRPLTWSRGYHIENVFEGLDQPGEWYFNKKTRVLYYMPLPDEDLRSAEMMVPMTQQWIRFQGDAANDKFVHHIRLIGLTFQYSAWELVPEGYNYPQAEVPSRAGDDQTAEWDAPIPSAIYAEGAHDLVLQDNVIAHTGAWGIELARACRDNQIVGNHLYDLGAGGVRIGQSEDRSTGVNHVHSTTITDNTIQDGCRVYLGAPGIWLGQSSNNLIAHNEISGTFEWAISVGWDWDFAPNPSRDNIIEYNHCHDICGPMGTHGVIYTLGVSPGTVIRYNHIHHASGGAFGIALDAGCAGILVEKNLVHHCDNGFHFNYGCSANIIHNNIFALTREALTLRYGDRPPPGTLNTNLSYRNLYYMKEGKVFYDRRPWPDFHTYRDHNLYFDGGGREVKFLQYTLPEFQEKGLERHSIIADPLFVDPEKGDFRLKPESPAFKLGFEPFDVSTAGPRKRDSKASP